MINFQSLFSAAAKSVIKQSYKSICYSTSHREIEPDGKSRAEPAEEVKHNERDETGEQQ